MAKYYIRYNDLQAQAESFKNISKTLDGFEGRLNSIVKAMDGRDSSMASLKRQVQNCGKSMPSLVNTTTVMGNVVLDVTVKYLTAEKDSYGLLDKIHPGMDIGLRIAFERMNERVMDGANAQIPRPDINDFLPGLLVMLDSTKKSKKAISSIDDLLELFGNDDNPLLDAMKKSGIYKAMSYTSDATKLIDAFNTGNYSGIGELAEKYIKKGGSSIAKNVYGATGFTASAYINLAWNFGENILDFNKYAYAGTSNSPIVGAAQYFWHCTGESILETGAEMGYDIVDGVGGLFGYDIDKVYKDLVGVDGVEGFYKAAGQLGDELFGDYYKNSGIVEGTVNLVGDTIGWWGSTISGWFK